jgi:thioredoxin 1
MAILQVTEKTFEEITRTGIVLIDCWAAWCGPCRRFAPIFEAAANRHPDVTFAKMDTEAERGLSMKVGIRAIPTLMVYKDGVLLLAQAGMVPGRTLDELVGAVKGLESTV